MAHTHPSPLRNGIPIRHENHFFSNIEKVVKLYSMRNFIRMSHPREISFDLLGENKCFTINHLE